MDVWLQKKLLASTEKDNWKGLDIESEMKYDVMQKNWKDTYLYALFIAKRVCHKPK